MEDPARTAGGGLGEYAYGRGGERPTSELVRDIIGNVQEMVRSEIRLVRAELKEEGAKALAGGKKLAIAAGAGFFAVAFFLTAAAVLLSFVMPVWGALLLVGGVLAIAAALLFTKARRELRVPKPEKAIENVKETVEWMKNQTKS